MNKNEFSPSFRHVRLLLAREKGHPSGDPTEGYDLVIPLDRESRLDPAEWKQHQAACRVRYFRPDREDIVGRLRRKPGGQWFFDFAEGDADDEVGFRLGEERFTPGEYISIKGNRGMHTYQVARVAEL